MVNKDFLKAIKGIPSTADQTQSYYQFLEDFYQRDNSTKKKTVRENIKILGSGTDHASFAYYAGVPSTISAPVRSHCSWASFGKRPGVLARS